MVGGRRYILLIAGLLLTGAVSARTTLYVADNTSNFPNPERGFTTAWPIDITKQTTATNYYDHLFTASAGLSLVQRIYTLSGFREDSLSEQVLRIIDEDFGLFRSHGFKCVLRINYTNQQVKVKGKYQDGSPEIWKKHLQQLKPILHKNADVIALVQAGFLGVWGEWHSSSTDTPQGAPQYIKDSLINQLLDAVPQDRAIEVRTPRYKIAYMGDSLALSDEEAFTGTPRARIGQHNDAFLYQSTDWGTYVNRAWETAWMNQECLYLPFGGEMCVGDLSIYKQWASGDKALAEMAYLHMDYLNLGGVMINEWRHEGVFNDIAMRMGYRFELTQTTIPATATPGERLPIHISIKNVGFSPLYNERKAYLLLRGSDSIYTYLLKTDPRRWLPNGAITELTDTLTLPADMKEATYEVLLWLPDVYASIQHDPRYAIRMANDGVWEAATGYNHLRTTVAVSATPVPEPPEPEPQPQADVEAVTDLMGTAGTDHIRLSWTNPYYGPVMRTTDIDLSAGKSAQEASTKAQISYRQEQTIVDYATTDVWQFTGVEYPVSGVDSTTQIRFSYKGDGQSLSLLAYAWDGTYRWVADPVEHSLNSTTYLNEAFTPTRSLWIDHPQWRYGEKKITHIGFIANPPTATKGRFWIKDLQLAQTTDSVAPFAGVRVVRDSTTVYYGRDNYFVDEDVSWGNTYRYDVYTFDRNNRYAYPVSCTVTVDGSGWQKVGCDSKEVQKVCTNGHFYIIRDGKLYNALGQEQ